MSNRFDPKVGIAVGIPSDRPVSYTLVSQAQKVQKMQIKDPNGQVIVDVSVQGMHLQGETVGHFVTKIGGEYTVLLPNAAAGKGLSCTVPMTLAQKVVSETLLIAVEDLDKGDDDYNDAFVTVTWFTKMT
jgi:hypothetical protein